MRIGYAGGRGSFAEQAARQLVLDATIDKTFAVTHAEMLLSGLFSDELDAILLPIKFNGTAAGTRETNSIVKEGTLDLINTIEVSSELCLFATKDTYLMHLSFVAGPFAYIKQTRQARRKRWRDMSELEVDNSAPLGYLLTTGQLSRDVAILCSKEEGITAGLQLLDDAVLSRSKYTITYGLFKKSPVRT